MRRKFDIIVGKQKIMREYFLDTPLSWVEMQLNIHKNQETAAKDFGDDIMRISVKMGVAYQDCFSDFLLFEYRPIFFYYKSAIEYFSEYNPQGLDKKILSEYKEIAETQRAGLFEIKRVTPAGLEIYNKELGEIFVHRQFTKKYFFETGEIIWARVAKVNALWYFVNEFTPPILLKPGVSKVSMLTDMSVREISHILFADRELLMNKSKSTTQIPNFLSEKMQELHDGAEINMQKMEDFLVEIMKDMREDLLKDMDDPEEILEEVRENFEKIRKQLEIEHLFSIDTFQKWIDKEGEQNADFAFRALIYLVPDNFMEDTNQNNHELYIQSGQMYINAYLTAKRVKKVLNAMDNVRRVEDLVKMGEQVNDESKIKSEAMKSISMKVTHEGMNGEFVMREYSWEPYQRLHAIALQYLRESKFKDARDTYVKLVDKLFTEEVLHWPAFRFYANCASAAFLNGEVFLAIALAEASLRLNPQYEFAKKIRTDFLKSISSKKVQDKMLHRFYKDTPFERYEKYLNENGVNLNRKVTQKVNMYQFPV